MRHLSDIADEMVRRLTAAGVAGGNVVRGMSRTQTQEDAPLAVVFVRQDAGTPAGSSRGPVVELRHTATVNVGVFEVGNTGAQVEAGLCAHGQAIAEALLEVPWALPNVEGVEGTRTEISFDDEGRSIIGQLVMEIDFLLTINWAPAPPPDDFSGINATLTE